MGRILLAKASKCLTVSFSDVTHVFCAGLLLLFWSDSLVVFVCRAAKILVQSDVIGGIRLSINSVGSCVWVWTLFASCCILSGLQSMTFLCIAGLHCKTVPASYIPVVGRSDLIAIRVCVGFGMWREKSSNSNGTDWIAMTQNVFFFFGNMSLRLVGLLLLYYAGVLFELPCGVAHADPIFVHSTLGWAATHVTSLALISALTDVRFAGKW